MEKTKRKRKQQYRKQYQQRGIENETEEKQR